MPSEIELQRRTAGRAHACLDGGGELTQMMIAGSDLAPGIRDADQGAIEILPAEAARAQHRPRRRPAGPLGDDPAALIQGSRRLFDC